MIALLLTLAQAAILHTELDTTIPLIHASIAFRGGYASDPQGREGITAFLCKMLLRGTIIQSRQELSAAFDDLGTTIFCETHADYTALHATMLSRNAAPSLRLIKDVLEQPRFQEDECTILRDEMIAQLDEEQNSDMSLALSYSSHAAFGQKHPYGHGAYGRKSTLRAITQDQLRQHSARTLHTQNAIILVSGDFQKDMIESWVKNLGLSSVPLEAKTSAPSTYQPSMTVIDKKERTQSQIIFTHPGPAITKSAPLMIANHAFGGGMFSSTLMREIRVNRGLSYGARSRFLFATEPYLWQAFLYPATKRTQEAYELAWQLIRNWIQKGISQDEFLFAQESLIKSADFQTNTPSKRLENKLHEVVFGLEEGFFAHEKDRIKNITYPEVNAALKAFFRPENISVTLLGTHLKLDNSTHIDAASINE